ncbi:MAG: GNAT family N-acetyltransferase [Pseudomonadota bacterium]
MAQIIESERLRLRPLKSSDAGLISLYTSDLRVARMTRSIPYPNPPGAVDAFIASVLNGKADEQVWAIDHRGPTDEQLIGLISLKFGHEIGYWLGASFWDTGFATEAVQALVQQAGSAPLTGEVFQDNPASVRVLTKAGFAYVGDSQSYSIARQAIVDIWRYEREAVPCARPA